MFSTTPSFRRKREKKGKRKKRKEYRQTGKETFYNQICVISTKIPETEMQVKHGTSLELASDLQASFC